MTAAYTLTLISSYFIGGIPFALIIGKSQGVDIREHGSGNVGATNVGRVCGKKWGIIAFICDSTKGFLPVFTVNYLYTFDNPQLAMILAAIGAYLGHVFTPYLKFKGGKGVATAAGALLALSPIPTAIAFVSWAICLACSKMISLSSIVAAAVLPLVAFILLMQKAQGMSYAVFALLFCLGMLTIYRHKSNIKRILAGEEPRIGEKKEKLNENSSS